HRRNVTLDYVAGDMRSLPWKHQFDRVVNWFTAYGYFDDAGNRQVLAEIAEALVPGGGVGLDMLHRDWMIPRFQPDRVAAERDGDLMIDRPRLDPLTSRAYTERLLLRGGRTRRRRVFVPRFTFTALP